MANDPVKSVRGAKLPDEVKRRLADAQDAIASDRGEVERIASDGFMRLAGLREAVAALSEARRQRGLPIDAVAGDAGMTSDELAELEADPHPAPTWEQLHRLAAAIGVKLAITVSDAA
ncbi:MAG: helix-turn-helix transcriptional regulator [Planctomycetota bacterium]